MLRYYAISACIVLGFLVFGTAWAERDLIRIKIASVYASAPPKPEPASTTGHGSAAGLRGDAPWALSALPECLIQTSETTGPLDYVLKHLPSGAVQIVPPAVLAYCDCTIFVRGDEAYVRRGVDRFRIPPRVRLYRTAGSLALLRLGPGGNELRVYQPSSE